MIWQVLDAVGSVLFVADALGLTAFAVRYWWRSRHDTEAGRVFGRLVAVIATIMVAAVLLPLIGNGLADYLRIILRVLLYGLLLGGVIHLNVLLWRLQRRDHNSTTHAEGQ